MLQSCFPPVCDLRASCAVLSCFDLPCNVFMHTRAQRETRLALSVFIWWSRSSALFLLLVPEFSLQIREMFLLA